MLCWLSTCWSMFMWTVFRWNQTERNLNCLNAVTGILHPVVTGSTHKFPVEGPLSLTYSAAVIVVQHKYAVIRQQKLSSSKTRSRPKLQIEQLLRVVKTYWSEIKNAPVFCIYQNRKSVKSIHFALQFHSTVWATIKKINFIINWWEKSE